MSGRPGRPRLTTVSWFYRSGLNPHISSHANCVIKQCSRVRRALDMHYGPSSQDDGALQLFDSKWNVVWSVPSPTKATPTKLIGFAMKGKTYIILLHESLCVPFFEAEGRTGDVTHFGHSHFGVAH